MTEPTFCCDRLRLAWEYRWSYETVDLVTEPVHLVTIESRYNPPAEHCPYCGEKLAAEESRSAVTFEVVGDNLVRTERNPPGEPYPSIEWSTVDDPDSYGTTEAGSPPFHPDTQQTSITRQQKP